MLLLLLLLLLLLSTYLTSASSLSACRSRLAKASWLCLAKEKAAPAEQASPPTLANAASWEKQATAAADSGGRSMKGRTREAISGR